METEYTMTSKKCGFCEKPIPRMQSRYYVDVYSYLPGCGAFVPPTVEKYQQF